ncbi:OB-fold nucleic acid binding domain-containing protein [Nitrobacter vulgaris]|uniref:OB-fold nucleic acid binding domain-containing protein n=1 Tax=Nitrobacter vulgaris TaxID=29421 RepID=UPI001FCD44FF|nr:OB-fold nucleic acid binding domain-containing protein [Nitrobacter vulgaris]
MLPVMSLPQHVVQDYGTTALSLKAHPVSFVREKLTQLRIACAADLKEARDAAPIKVAGLVLVRQRPGTAGGVCFMTIEDETGVSNLVIFKTLFSKFRREILHSRLIMVDGKVQREGDVIHVIVKTCHDLTHLMRGMTEDETENLPLLTLAHADERSPSGRDSRDFIPSARNFK